MTLLLLLKSAQIWFISELQALKGVSEEPNSPGVGLSIQPPSATPFTPLIPLLPPLLPTEQLQLLLTREMALYASDLSRFACFAYGSLS